MSETPEALRLADCLDGNAKTPWKREEAAAELRRLHPQRDELLAVNAGLMQAARQALEALEAITYRIERDLEHDHEWAVVERELANEAIAALR